MSAATGSAQLRVPATDPGRTHGTSAPSWWPPRSGDVAVFSNCVEGGEPYLICVSYNYAERAWMNVTSGGVLPRQPYPGDLTVLVRDGQLLCDCGGSHWRETCPYGTGS